MDGGNGGYDGNNDSNNQSYGPSYNGGDDSKDYGPGYNAGNESKDYGPGYNGGKDYFRNDSYDNKYDDISKIPDDNNYSKNHVDAITSCDDDDVNSPDGSLGRTLVTALAAMGPAALATGATANDKTTILENGFTGGPDYSSALLTGRDEQQQGSGRRQKDDVEDSNCTKDCMYYSLACCYDCSLM